MAKPAYKETNAFQAAGPLMKEHLGLLELSETKESKIAHVVNFFSDLIISEKRDQLEKAGVNSNKGRDKRRRVEVTTKGRATQSAFNRYKKQSCNMQVDAANSNLNVHVCD
jgi:predicted transcriptional regulator